jgi:hypothetical protein
MGRSACDVAELAKIALDTHIVCMTVSTDKTLKREQQRVEGEIAWAEYQAERDGLQDRMARQRAARLARDAAQAKKSSRKTVA